MLAAGPPDPALLANSSGIHETSAFRLGSAGDGTAIQGVSQNATTPERYEKFEVTFQLSATYANPFDPDEANVAMKVVQPDQSPVTIPAFYYTEFDAQPGAGGEHYVNGRGAGWKARFTPAQIGAHTFSLSVTDAHGTTTLADAGSFECVASARSGFVRVDPGDSRFFIDDGANRQFIALGENIAWDDGQGIPYWQTHFDALANNGGNWARIWMSTFYVGTSIEGSQSQWTHYYQGVGRYSLQHAWKLDRILELAEARGIRIQLVLQHHGQFSTSVDANWNDNPYNRDGDADGGFLDSPQEFFSNPQAKMLFQQKLRYLIARWGYSTSIFAWEFFNEVNFTDGFREGLAQREIVAQWHQEMSAWLATHDPFQHLRTTSGNRPAGEPDLAGADPNMQIIQVHTYSDPIKLEKFRQDTQALSVYGKAVMFSEFGAGTDAGITKNPEEDSSLYPALQQAQIAEGLVLHNGLWSASHLASSAGLWWWEYVLDNGLDTQFRPLQDYWAGETPGAWNVVPATLDRVQVTGGTVLAGLTVTTKLHDFYRVPTQTIFPVRSDGSVDGLENLNDYIHGTWQERLRSDPTFVLSLARQENLVVYVSQVSSYGTNSLQILVDGQVVPASRDPIDGQAFQLTAAVPAGPHRVQIRNAGQDWFRVTQYAFGGFDIPVTRCLGQIGDERAYLWFYDVDSEYRHVNHGILSGVTATLQGLADAAYVVEYWNTRGSGGLRSQETQSTSGGTLTFALPDFDRDIAVKVRPLPVARVVGRHAFYNNSVWDGNSPGADPRDYDALAPAPPLAGHGHAANLDEPAKELGKQALLPGQTARLMNYTSNAKGLNGILIAFDNLADPGTLTLGDFQFRVGNSTTPADWTAAPAPSAIRLEQNVTHAAFVGQPDVVTITWADDDPYTSIREPGAISNQWLEVTVLANANTGLQTNDVFYFGNQVGESGNSTIDTNVDQNDEIGARNHPHTAFNAAAICDPYDFNRDGKVDQNDEILARNNPASAFTRIQLIAAPAILQAGSLRADASQVGQSMASDTLRDAVEVGWMDLLAAVIDEMGRRRGKPNGDAIADDLVASWLAARSADRDPARPDSWPRFQTP